MMGGDTLRIAIFSDSALPILNGVSVSIDALVTELRRQGHSVHIYAPRFPSHRDGDPNTFRFRSFETPLAQGYPIAMAPFYGMLRQFRSHEYDVIHTHTPFTLGMVGLRWGESHGLPVVSTYHTLYDRYAHYFRLLPRRYIRFRLAKHTNFYYSAVSHVITPSEASLKWLRRHSVQTQATVIPTGITHPAALERWESRQRLGIPPESKLLLYVGRLAKEKNLTTMLQAVAIASSQDPELRLWLVGDGPFRDECTALVRKLGIGDRVRFVGFVDRSRVGEYYSAADLFLFSSFTETQGLVVQEAMMHSLPAVVVSGGGAGLAVEHGINGYVTKNDPVEFSKYVLMALADDSRYAGMAEAAVRSVRAQGVSEMCCSVVAVYREVIRVQPQCPNPRPFAWL